MTSEQSSGSNTSSEDDLLMECDVEEVEDFHRGETEVLETAVVGVFPYRFEPEPEQAPLATANNASSTDTIPQQEDRSTEGYNIQNWYESYKLLI